MFRSAIPTAIIVAACASASVAVAAESPDAAAHVNGQPIAVAEVERTVKQLVADRAADPNAKNVLSAEALEQLIDRRLVLGYLTDRKLGANRQEVRLAIRRLEERLGQQGVTLADYLQQGGIDEGGLETRFAWQIGWQRYLKRYLTDENLSKFFDKHRHDFDGTEIRAAQILFKVNSADVPEGPTATLKRAETLRQEVLSHKITFEAAAEKHSQAPTAKWGGDVGFISRHKSMPEEFSAAAFALEVGEVSPPVVTGFGVHLIKCLEVKPGKKRWPDVRRELEPAAGRFLFRWIADRERPGATIEYTGAVPRFKPGTKELVE